MNLFLNQFLKFFFLITPFFVLSMYLSMTQEWEQKQKFMCSPLKWRSSKVSIRVGSILCQTRRMVFPTLLVLSMSRQNF